MTDKASNLFRLLLRNHPPTGVLAEGRHHLDASLARVSPYVGPIEKSRTLDLSRVDELKRADLQWAFLKGLGPLWLAGMGQPACAEGEVEGLLYQVYCSSLSRDSVTSLPHQDLDLDRLLRPATQILAQHLLTLRHHGRSYLPEILGVTWAAMTLEPLRSSLSGKSIDLANRALSKAIGLNWDDERIRKGFSLYDELITNLVEDLNTPMREISNREAFGKVIRRKAQSAIGYHQKISLKGESLDEWLSRESTTPDHLLKALETSPWIEPSCPFKSRLVRAMAFGGPMFGVFEPDEERLAVQWIEEPEQLTKIVEEFSYDDSVVFAPDNEKDRQRLVPTDSKSLFHQLIAAQNPAEAPEQSRTLIRKTIRRTRHLRQLRVLPKAFPYDPLRLDRFLETTHQRALAKQSGRLFEMNWSRKDWIWILKQLAPAVLIDGAWLSGVPGPLSGMQPWHHKLIRIHEDELGRGDPQKNHPLIYRRLLQSLEIDTPSVSDPAFCRDPLISDAAFNFPTYMLAIGLHFHEFEPECLGLNLAIELSGLGSGYQNVIRSLKAQGIDPLIAELHLSIDNLDSGHARQARDAIVMYLEWVIAREGREAGENAWLRIYDGYLSYRVSLFAMAADFLKKTAIKHLPFLRRIAPHHATG